MPVHGHCDPRFAALREALEQNFAERGELGAALTVSVDGKPVADLWGGWADEARTREWTPDTLVNVFSVGKAMASICLLRLVERGRIELDAPVAARWPQFAARGKEAVTLRMVLAHRAGLPGVSRPLPDGAMYDLGLMSAALADEGPWWEPGTAHGYHVNSFGFLLAEIVRRVSGESIGEMFEREVGGPLGAEFHWGIGPQEDDRVAEFLFDAMASRRAGEGLAGPGEDERDRREALRRIYFNPPGISGLGTVNTRAWRAAQIASTNGHGTARGVARVYGALARGGTIDGVRVLDAETIERATAEQSAGPDLVLHRPTRFGLGFQLTQPERPLGASPRSFGHFGAGGSLGFADPDERLAFGYVMNRAGPRWQNPRNRALVDAVYSSL